MALAPWSRFGRARHPAALNFGDCLAYAVARVAQRPLLAKGHAFPQTDLELA
jgi:ribonuclease VapC